MSGLMTEGAHQFEFAGLTLTLAAGTAVDRCLDVAARLRRAVVDSFDAIPADADFEAAAAGRELLRLADELQGAAVVALRHARVLGEPIHG